ncbi:hypothetical protein SMU21_03101 [Streptococcus mutans 1SM1]|nr:hypothetical protein SMU21_03101 [Streptococcus mutans 1SM1]
MTIITLKFNVQDADLIKNMSKHTVLPFLSLQGKPCWKNRR